MPKKKYTSNENLNFQLVLIKAILASSPEGVLVVNEKGVIQFYNNRFFEVWHLSPQINNSKGIQFGDEDAPLLARATELVSDPQLFLSRVNELYEHPELTDICEITLKDGRTLERHSTALWSDGHQYLGRVWFFRDISTHKTIESNLSELTRLDPLTNVANRRYFFERGLQEFDHYKRCSTTLSIASIDIDHFKLVNDRYGHAAGDEMLKSLCQVCTKILRKSDLFARIGGEEFALLLPGTDLTGALKLAERIRMIVSDNILVYNGYEIRCTISIGVARLRLMDTCINDCLNRADAAMYRAKEKGRNRVESE